MAVMTIGTVARAAGVGVETIRYYERTGLLAPPPRTASGYRQYGLETVRRITFIKRAQRLGFTLSEAAELVALHETAVPCAEVERRALAKIAEIEARIAALSAVRENLSALLARCETECATGCTVLLDEREGLPREAIDKPGSAPAREEARASPGCGSSCQSSR